jgi:hypothetical protein
LPEDREELARQVLSGLLALSADDSKARWYANRSSYSPGKHCVKVVELAHECDTLNQIAKGLGVSRALVDVWRKRYPEFKEAWNLAKTILTAKFEEGYTGAMSEKGSNAAMWIVRGKTLDKGYHDRLAFESDDLAQRVEIKLVLPEMDSSETWERKVKELRSQKQIQQEEVIDAEYTAHEKTPAAADEGDDGGGDD